MTNTNKSIWLRTIIIIFALVVCFLCLRVTFTKEAPTPTFSPTPTVVVKEVDKMQQYIDQMTGKCYADTDTPQEREVPCKG